METIKDYLDNMFAGLPKSAQVKRLKEDLLTNMEEKYNELKLQGKTENEAIGIVISEFGNIEEIIKEYGLEVDKQDKNLRSVGLEEAKGYLDAKRKTGIYIGVGVMLCILSPAILIVISSLLLKIVSVNSGLFEVLGLAAFFIFIAAAVGIFIFAGTKMEKYKYLKNAFELQVTTLNYVTQKKEDFNPTFVVSIITGVVLCILSPMALIGISYINPDSEILSEIGVIAMFVMAAVAVHIFIWAGSVKESFNVLLKLEEYSEKKKEENKVIGAVASVVWPLTVCAFLVWGFLFDGWGISWILFPIVGILFGSFSAAYNTLKGNK